MVDEGIMQRVKVLYASVAEAFGRRCLTATRIAHLSVSPVQVRNLPLSATEMSLLHAFSRFKPGCVQRVKKLSDYAFVHFHCREDAMEALALMHGAVIDGVAIEVMLAKPAAVKDRNNKRTSSRALLGSGSLEEQGPAVQRVRIGSLGSSPTSSEDSSENQRHCNYLHVPAEGELELQYKSHC